MGSLESVDDPLSLSSLLVMSEDVATTFTIITTCLNTAPVTLAYLSKECRAVTGALRRLDHVMRNNASDFATLASGEFSSSCQAALASISTELSILKLSGSRILPKTRRDSGTDVNEAPSDLVIIWNEDILKQSTSRLKTVRTKLSFLLDCVQPDNDAASISSAGSTRSTRLLDRDVNIDPALLHMGSRLRLSIVAPCPPEQLYQVTQTPEIQKFMAQLQPREGVVYQSNQKMCQQLHFAIDRKDEAAVLKLLLQQVEPGVLQPGSKLSPLHRAFNVASAPIATLLAIAGADLNEPNANGETALIRGVKCIFADTFVSLLCELGARIDEVDNHGCSALHHAAAMQNKGDVLAVLISAGADVNRKDYDGRTPLTLAVEAGRLKEVDTLIEYGADIDVRLPSRKTALFIAITKRNTAMVKLLVDRGAQLDLMFGEHTALTFAISTACEAIVGILIESGADVNCSSATGNFPLLAATAMGNMVVVERLLAQGALVDKANNAGYTTVHMAALKNKLDTLKLLLSFESPPDPVNELGETPLAIAATLGHDDIVQFLLDSEADMNHSPPGGESVLLSTLRAGKLDTARLLILGGADLITPDGEDGGITPIHLAAQEGLNGVLLCMIKKGVTIDTTVWTGFTPLFHAAQYGQLHTVRLLLRHGANKMVLNAAGNNLLSVATPHPVILKLLLKIGVPVNQRNERGATALHYAALGGHMLGVKTLLQKGARQFHASAVFETMEDSRDGTGYRQGTPAGVARQKGFLEVAKLIERWKK